MANRSRMGRLLGILLVLRSKEWVAAQELATRFRVSTRTIYRDVEVMQ
jgi:predicted DNA-binding transcriptional regulator YafY